MNDYTVSHPCGLEDTCETVFEAKKFARDHVKICKIDSSAPNGEIIIDEYNHEEGELSGRYWTFDGKKFIEK